MGFKTSDSLNGVKGRKSDCEGLKELFSTMIKSVLIQGAVAQISGSNECSDSPPAGR